MDKTTFASYKFQPSDVIEGLNRYFAESKAFRYRRVPLEIKNREVKPGNYYVIRDIVFDVSTPKIKECGYGYVICDPEEVVGVAINWLREEHYIFYAPGIEVPKYIFGKRLADLRKYDSDLAIDVENLKEQLRVLRYNILKVYREIFDCSNGDPEGTDEETLQDILTEYQRVLELKNVAEEKTIKYKELARENEERAAKYVQKLIEIQDICER